MSTEVWSVCRDRCPHHMSVALALLILARRPLSKGKKWKSVWKRLRWHTGSTTDLINCETHWGVMQLWGCGDYCLPVMLIINLIKLQVEEEREMSQHTHLDANHCVSETAFGRREKRVAVHPSERHITCAHSCHLGLTSHSPEPCHNLFADPK